MDDHELRQIPLTAFFIAAAVILPQFFHFFGLGATFLPMFLPVFAGAMLLRWKYALVLGIISPLVSWLLTGMPPIIPPVLPVLLVELSSSALLISLLRFRWKRQTLLSLIVAILWDRLLLFFLVYLIAPLFGLTHPLFSAVLIISGLPGIILMFLFIPWFVPAFEKRYPEYSA